MPIPTPYEGSSGGPGRHRPASTSTRSAPRWRTDPDSRRNVVSAWNVGLIPQMALPELVLHQRDSIFEYTYDDVEIRNYDPHPPVKAPVAV